MSGRYAALSAALVALSLLIASLAPVAQGASGGTPGAPGSRPTQKPKPTPSPSPTPYLEGLDVSVYQSTIDWNRVAAAGKKFAIIRASAGSLTADTKYAANRSGAKAAGLPIGAYHFANPDTATNDALNEANWFLQNATPTHGEMIPALDVEVTNGLSVSAMQTWVSTWLTRVSSVLGVKPMIYSSPNFWATSMGDTLMFADGGYKILWIAHWTSASQPTVPAGNWGGNGWTFWQYTSSGTVPGITGNADLDRYNGTTLASSLFIP
jgi:lysozyme